MTDDPTAAPVTVTQADEKASGPVAIKIMIGELTHGDLQQAFARHRIASTAAQSEADDLRAEVQRLREALERIANDFDRNRHIIQSIARQALAGQP